MIYLWFIEHPWWSELKNISNAKKFIALQRRTNAGSCEVPTYDFYSEDWFSLSFLKKKGIFLHFLHKECAINKLLSLNKAVIIRGGFGMGFFGDLQSRGLGMGISHFRLDKKPGDLKSRGWRSELYNPKKFPEKNS